MASRRTRLAAYIVATNEDQLLLARVAPGYPAAGRWTLPGGGIEWGEHPEDALGREVYEESGFTLDEYEFLGFDSVTLTDGDGSDLHWIRILYRADLSGEPRVTEIDGSVDDAQWIPIADLDATNTVGLVIAGLRLARRR